MAKAKLHEVLAVEQDLSHTAVKVVNEAGTTFHKKPDHFMGFSKTTRFFDDSRSEENTDESKRIVTTVGAKLDHVTKHLARYFDAMAQKEATNQLAKADLVVNGTVLVEGAPATWLLGMETRLKDLRKMYEAIPTLSPGVLWTKDEAAGKGIWVAPAQASFQTKKTAQHKVLYDATENHPAEIEKWFEDVPVARIEKTESSGMITSAQKAALLDRLDTLIQACKKARQRANATEVVQVKPGQAILAYVHGALEDA